MLQRTKPLLALRALLVLLAVATVARADDTRDLTWFLRRLRTFDHIPELENSLTAMTSTWDRSGGNNDGKDFKRLEGSLNILLDVDGPGCIHRIFTGRLGEDVAGTRIQFLFDGASTPAIDLPVDKFFDDRHGPIPYPLVFHKTYPGLLLPIPYAKHCRIQLLNEKKRNWGQYWQITYTTYAPDTKVQTLVWPPSPGEIQEMQVVGARWLESEKTPPPAPTKWTGEKQDLIPPGKSIELQWDKSGIFRQWRISIEPDTPEIAQQLWLQMFWDGNERPSVDVPLGSFFGYAPPASGSARYQSLLIGIAGGEAYCCLPMPFVQAARWRLVNGSDRPVKATIRWDLETTEAIHPDWGRFHATYHAAPAAMPTSPKYGGQPTPTHLLLEQAGRGKYVGAMLQVIWPWSTWWGEGDWLIWTDQTDWPPRYHGTGTEQYFNSGGGKFDRKALSGLVATRREVKSVYTFHLNDSFQFEKNIRVAVETLGGADAGDTVTKQHPIWSSTAFWYDLPAQPAGSTERVYLPEKLDYVRAALASQPASSAPATAPAHLSK